MDHCHSPRALEGAQEWFFYATGWPMAEEERGHGPSGELSQLVLCNGSAS